MFEMRIRQTIFVIPPVRDQLPLFRHGAVETRYIRREWRRCASEPIVADESQTVRC